MSRRILHSKRRRIAPLIARLCRVSMLHHKLWSVLLVCNRFFGFRSRLREATGMIFMPYVLRSNFHEHRGTKNAIFLSNCECFADRFQIVTNNYRMWADYDSPSFRRLRIKYTLILMQSRQCLVSFGNHRNKILFRLSASLVALTPRNSDHGFRFSVHRGTSRKISANFPILFTGPWRRSRKRISK